VTMMTIVGGNRMATVPRPMAVARNFSYASHPPMNPTISGGKCRYACTVAGEMALQTVGWQ
jgi:hypothetical protein